MDNIDYYWYKSKNPHEKIFAFIKALDNRQGYRQQENIRNMKLYGNNDYLGITAYNFYRTEPTASTLSRVTLNVVQSMIDTVVSKLTKNKPRPYFLTEGGDYLQQKRAEKLTQFMDGIFYNTKFYEKAAIAFKDACIFGTGAIKLFIDPETMEIKAERVFIDEIMLDDNEAYYGEPRQIHQRKWIHKDVLKEMFPKFAGSIDAVTSDASQAVEYRERNGDMVLVVESWRLPSGAKATDGKHTICIPNETLFEEKYTKSYFPFIFFRWNSKPIGFFGQGISEQLTGLQLEINKILRTIQVSMHLVSVPKIFIEASSKIVTAHLDNKIGGIIKYAGQPPTEGKLGSIPVELFNHLDRLYSRAYEIIGISQLAAQSVKPAGLNSGKALRTYNDLESERFQSVQKQYENGFIQAANICVDLAKDLNEMSDSFKVKVPGSKFLETIQWDDVAMSEDAYVLQIFPTNALSQDPSSRLQEVQELMQAGLMSPQDGKRLLDYPDLKAFYNMENAAVEDINMQIERMANKGEYQTPEPYQDLQYGIAKMQQAYLYYRANNAPEELLELFRRWMSDADTLIQSAQQRSMEAQMAAQQAALPPQPAVAPAAPEAPPISELVPNIVQ